MKIKNVIETVIRDDRKFRLTRADGSQVQPVWMVLAVLAENGFRIKGGGVRSTTHDGSFAVGDAIYKGPRDGLVAALDRITAELGDECVYIDDDGRQMVCRLAEDGEIARMDAKYARRMEFERCVAEAV